MKLLRAVVVACLGALAIPTLAQDIAPLIRSNDASVSVSVGKKDEKNIVTTPTPIPAPTPDPTTVIVALVNQHTITKAQMNRRVAALMGERDGQINAEELVPMISPEKATQTSELVDQLADNEALRVEQVIMEQQQRIELEDAIRRQEEELVYNWVDQMKLADEARRQGLVISDRELQDRMKRLESEFQLSSARVASMLDMFGMSRAEFESYVYDALLIEKLLNRYVEMNFTEEMFLRAYNQAPQLYITPPAYKMAHFVITFSAYDTDNVRKGYRKIADDVRQQLISGEDPEAIFARENEIQDGIFGSVLTWSIASRHLDNNLRQEIMKLEEGKTSRVIVVNDLIDGRLVPVSYHVIKILEYFPQSGMNYEEAKPMLKKNSTELARQDILDLIRQARTHRVFINLNGIPPKKLPAAAELRKPQPPISLKL